MLYVKRPLSRHKLHNDFFSKLILLFPNEQRDRVKRSNIIIVFQFELRASELLGEVLVLFINSMKYFVRAFMSWYG